MNKKKNKKLYTSKDALHGILNRRFKIIQPQKRSIYLSKELINKIKVSNKYCSVLFEIQNKSINGESLKAYCHRHEDLLDEFEFNEKILNATGLFHMHLSHQDLDGYVKRTDDYLWVYPTANAIYLIDILPHYKWSENTIHLYNIILANWIELLKFNMPGPLDGSKPSEQDVFNGIMGNVNVIPVLDDGKAYFLLGRITSDGSSGQILSIYDRIMDGHN